MRFTLLIILLAPSIASADQFIYNALPDALRGLQKLEAAKESTHFCAPCSNDKPRLEKVRDVGVDLVWDSRATSKPYNDGQSQYWQVFVNDKPVDMAYVYIRENGKWRNLAESIGLKPSDVPSTLKP